MGKSKRMIQREQLFRAEVTSRRVRDHLWNRLDSALRADAHKAVWDAWKLVDKAYVDILVEKLSMDAADRQGRSS